MLLITRFSILHQIPVIYFYEVRKAVNEAETSSLPDAVPFSANGELSLRGMQNACSLVDQYWTLLYKAATVPPRTLLYKFVFVLSTSIASLVRIVDENFQQLKRGYHRILKASETERNQWLNTAGALFHSFVDRQIAMGTGCEMSELMTQLRDAVLSVFRTALSYFYPSTPLRLLILVELSRSTCAALPQKQEKSLRKDTPSTPTISPIMEEAFRHLLEGVHGHSGWIEALASSILVPIHDLSLPTADDAPLPCVRDFLSRLSSPSLSATLGEETLLDLLLRILSRAALEEIVSPLVEAGVSILVEQVFVHLHKRCLIQEIPSSPE